MIYFDINQSKFKEGFKIHVDSLKELIWDRVKDFKEGEYKEYINHISIEFILGAEPKKLYQFNLLFYKALIQDFSLNKFEEYLKASAKKSKSQFKEFEDLRQDLNYIFDYKYFCDTEKLYNAYNLATKLDIPTCPYCNRLYTKTVINREKKKKTRPAFDHWFPKSKFPLLQLSFYNLIPSCNVCNSGVKGSKVYKLNELFHPYMKNEKFNFKYSYYNKDLNKYGFNIITYDKISKESVDAFFLLDIYEAHEDEIYDLRKIRDNYNSAYIESLKSILNQGNNRISESEIYRLAFGVHLEEDKFDRRPLSKMKRDILKELGIIN